jgi:tetratricopeptide (TPR) repeat protein
MGNSPPHATPAETETLDDEALERGLLPGRHRPLVVVGNALARQREGLVWARIAEAAELRRGAADDDLDRAQRLANGAALHFTAGRWDEAEAGFSAARAGYEAAVGPRSLAVAEALRNLAAVQGMQGHGPLAAELLEQTLSIQRAQLGSTHPDVARTLLSLGQAQGMQGDLEGARALMSEALDIRREVYGEESVFVAEVHEGLCTADNEQHHYESAQRHCTLAVEGYERTRGERHPDLASALSNLAVALAHLGQTQAATDAAERSLAIFTEAVGPEHPRTKHVQAQLERLAAPPDE